MEFLGDLAKDFFVAANRMLKDTDAQQTALIDLSIHSAWREKIDDGNGFALLSIAVNPANALLDHWMQQHQGQPFDDGGRWAASGQVLPSLLAALLAEPYLQRPPPKSTGRDLFNPAWLNARLAGFGGAAPADVQATLAEFTARAAADALLREAPGTAELLVCGGGALNTHLMARLMAALPGMRVGSTAEAGLPPLQVEAAAFAWLARACLLRQPGNRPEATGARGPRVLGAIYPA